MILKDKRGFIGIVLDKYRVFWMVDRKWKMMLGQGYMVDDAHDLGKIIGHIWFRPEIYYMALNTKE